MKKFGPAVADFTQVIKLNPTNLFAYVLRGDGELNLHLCQSSVADETIVIQSNKLTPQGQFLSYFVRGNAYGCEHSYDQDISDQTAAITLIPNDPVPYINRGIAYSNKNMWGHDINDQNTALNLPGISKISRYNCYIELAVAYNATKQFNAAFKSSSLAIALFPSFSRAYTERSVSYGKTGRYDKAIADDTTAITFNPKDDAAWNNRCWYRAIAGQLATALVDCKHSLQLVPGVAGTLDSLGFVYLKMQNYKASITNYTAAIKADPTLASSFYGRGLAEKASGNATAAKTDFAAAAKIDPGIAEDFGK
jgi:tetratricopeptide (TPR) repeat protein